ncbi:MAG: DUF2155 domain-containing protein [Geobacteraceae bacterium]
MRDPLRYLVIALLTLVAVTGCNKKEEGGEPVAPQGQIVKKNTVVVVPDKVKGKWKAVKIAVTDKRVNKDIAYDIPINKEFSIPNSNLSIRVENFLPHFLMDGTTLTSQSNEPKNPAAQVLIMEGGKEVFNGWLFMLYPTTHAFQHPSYGFTVVGFVPAD